MAQTKIKRSIKILSFPATKAGIEELEAKLNLALEKKPLTKIELMVANGTSPQIIAFLKGSESEIIEAGK
jgi:hypothetical protein